jgi:Ca2+ transporting ATPase
MKCGINNRVGSQSASAMVLEGPEFRSRVLDEEGNFRQAEFDKIWPHLRVLARSSPTDKYWLVNGLKATRLEGQEQIVAVTGDGTNDGPALKSADVGFAMGITGTAIAKEASDIILMDDNFEAIVSAVKWGRNVYDNIGKFLQFQLTVNIVAVTICFVGALKDQESPLSTVQMLWVNLIMDSLASLALATELPTDSLLERKPYPKSRSLLSKVMLRFMFGHAVYQLSVLFALMWAGYSMLGLEDESEHNHKYRNTVIFNTFVMMQIFNEINARRVNGELNVFRGLFDSRIFLSIIITTFIVQALLVTYGGSSIRAVPIKIKDWVICVVFGAGSLPWNVVLHFVVPKSFLKEKDVSQVAMNQIAPDPDKDVNDGNESDSENNDSPRIPDSPVYTPRETIIRSSNGYNVRVPTSNGVTLPPMTPRMPGKLDLSSVKQQGKVAGTPHPKKSGGFTGVTPG